MWSWARGGSVHSLLSLIRWLRSCEERRHLSFKAIALSLVQLARLTSRPPPHPSHPPIPTAEALLYGFMQLMKKMRRSRQATLWYRK